jgi:hypothetical protein
MNREHLIGRFEQSYFRGWVVSTRGIKPLLCRETTQSVLGRAVSQRSTQDFYSCERKP